MLSRRREGNIPLLTIEPDGTVFATGDKSKSDIYDLDVLDAT